MALSTEHDIGHDLNRRSSLWICVLGASALVVVCANKAYRSELVTYLQQEKELRMRMASHEALDDSVEALQRYYNIKLEDEYRMLKDNPESWLALIKELPIAK